MAAKSIINIVVFLTFFSAIGVHPQSPENLNIVYITNTIERPIYLEKLVIVTNIVEKIIEDNGIKPVYNKTIQKKYPNKYKHDQMGYDIFSYILAGLILLGILALMIYGIFLDQFHPVTSNYP